MSGLVLYENDEKWITIHDRPRRPNMEYLKACSERQGGAVAHEDIKEVIEYIEWLERERVK